MNKKTLRQLYAEHQGKVSDKWSLYLSEYDRLLKNYRDKPVRLLEIGVQNGGSLELWSKYFENASTLLGVDINPDCAQLSYDDKRIGVIVGDANAPNVINLVLEHSQKFDIIIDDGSHRSSDIVNSFAAYFPFLENGGLFIVEDLHCSYWEIFEGGLLDYNSSMSFFKHLTDIINHEHWDMPLPQDTLLRDIFTRYECSIGEFDLSQVHAVEFINSMCVVRKAASFENRLGSRVVSGSIEQVLLGHREMDGCPYHLDPLFDKTSNLWLSRTKTSDKIHQYTRAEQSLANAQQVITALTQVISERNGQINTLIQSVSERDEQINTLIQSVSERDGQINTLQNSMSWRLTKPLRILSGYLKKINRLKRKFFGDRLAEE